MLEQDTNLAIAGVFGAFGGRGLGGLVQGCTLLLGVVLCCTVLHVVLYCTVLYNVLCYIVLYEYDISDVLYCAVHCTCYTVSCCTLY